MTTEADSLAAAVEVPYDYIGVEASAGGAPLAANLADAGMRVLPLEAGIEGGTDSGSSWTPEQLREWVLAQEPRGCTFRIYQTYLDS